MTLEEIAEECTRIESGDCLEMIHIDEIRAFFRGRIAPNEPMSKYTSFRIGGPAEYYLEPADKSDIIALIGYLRRRQIAFMMMGKGSNMLVSDAGIRGIVINMEEGLNHIGVVAGHVVVEAGMSMARFVDFCIQRGYMGVEMLAGIPGTIGGAVMMNAGAYGGEISDHLVAVEVLREGEVLSVPREKSGFAYRRSGFQSDIILAATFSLPSGERAEIMKTRRDLLLKRNRAQPINMPNSGSMFKNPPGSFAAKLIEEAGLKGTRAGSAQISEKHANFIVNHGGATARDVLRLVEIAQEGVWKKFGVRLELEVKLIGFDADEYPKVHP